MLQARFHDNIADIPAADWDRLAGPAFPFLQHAFLLAAEESGSVTPQNGWQPCHLTLHNGNNQTVAAMPLYEKNQSWGEFVFDWGWAEAYQRAGLEYYPKLISAVPFTPASSRRLLTGPGDHPELADALLTEAINRVRQQSLSSLHILFPTEIEIPYFKKHNLLLRKDCQFHWHNQGYRNFSEFLDGFSAAKRKKARRERRRISESGISFRWLEGAQLDPDILTRVFELISITFMRRRSLPYFNLDFFKMLTERQSDCIKILVGERDNRILCTAMFFRGPDNLYGRYWGASEYISGLHFETCYYQGIEYCIEHDIKYFEPGTQGEHKVSRGFLPAATWSAHWLAHPDFNEAVATFLSEEQRYIDSYIDDVNTHSPFRKDST